MVFRSLLVLGILVGVTHRSSAETTPRIRIFDPVLRELFDQGVTQSPTFRSLVEKVEASSILVFVEGDIRMPVQLGARLNFVTSVNDFRYVRVAIDLTLPPRRQIALLAHELQHTLEIAERPDIVDVEAMESLYEDIGFPSFEQRRHRNFETDAAIAMQDAVSEELGGRTPKSPAAY
jgi:hypothetical protein